MTALASQDGVAGETCAEAGTGLADALLTAVAGLEAPTLSPRGGALASAPIAAALDERLGQLGRHRSPAAGSALDGALHLGQHLVEAGTLPEQREYLLVG